MSEAAKIAVELITEKGYNAPLIPALLLQGNLNSQGGSQMVRFRPGKVAAIATVATLTAFSLAPSSAPSVEKTSCTTHQFPLHGPFGLTRIRFSAISKLAIKASEASGPERADEPVLPRPVRIPTVRPMPPRNQPSQEPSADSTINAGNLPKVFTGFDVSKTGLGARDLAIAASTTHVIVTSSHDLTFWTRTGELLADIPTLTFYNDLKKDIDKTLKDPVDASKTVSDTYPINEFYDTRLIYDTYRKRFWITSLVRNMGPKPANPTPAQTEKWKHRVTVTAIAVSKAENPQDGFITYWMEPCRDYEGIGVSKKIFVIGYSASGTSFGSMAVMNPVSLAAGLSNQKATTLGDFKNPDGSAASDYMQPALQYGNSPSDLQFFVNNLGDGKTNVVWALDPNNLSQLYCVAVSVASYVGPKYAPQATHADIPHPSLVNPLMGGNMILKAICRGNKLYWVWDDSKPDDSRQIRFIRLNRVDIGSMPSSFSATGAVDRRFGKRNVSDPPNDIFSYYMPGLAVNKDATMLVTYSRSGATIWPEVRYSVYFANESDIRSSILMRKGEYPIGKEDPTYTQPADKRAGAGIYDYNGCAVDPLDDRSIWTVNVYAVKKSVGEGQYAILVRRIPVSGAP